MHESHRTRQEGETLRNRGGRTTDPSRSTATARRRLGRRGHYRRIQHPTGRSNDPQRLRVHENSAWPEPRRHRKAAVWGEAPRARRPTYASRVRLKRHRRAKNRTEAIRIFSSLAADPKAPSSEFRTQAAVAAIGNLVEVQRWDEARAFLSQLPPGAISTTALAALQGRVDLSAGERQKASEFATQANASIAAATSHEDIRLTARFLADLGRHRDALPLWQRLASPTCLGHDSYRLVESTLRLGEHRLLLAFCEQLRLNGIYDPQLIGLEAGIREHYDIEGTIFLLQEYLGRAPDDRNIRLQLSVIGTSSDAPNSSPPTRHQCQGRKIRRPKTGWPSYL